MIKNLNPITLGKYGKVIYKGFDYASKTYCLEQNYKKLCGDRTSIDELYKSNDTDVIIDVNDGIALLYITENPSNSDMSIYLLDKTVLIASNVYFNIAPLHGHCSVNVCHEKSSSLVSVKLNKAMHSYNIFPKVEINHVHTLFYQEKELNFSFKGEKHDFWELTYVDQGNLLTTIGKNTYCLKQGESIFYSPNQHHSQQSNSSSSVCFVTVTFGMTLDEYDFLTNRVFTINTEMKSILEKLLSEKNQTLCYSNDLIICYLKEFIIKLIRSIKLEHSIIPLDTDIQNNIENSIINTTLEYIHKHIYQKITIPEVASIIPISSSYLSKIFKKQMKLTIVDYITNYRLAKGKEMIRDSKYNFTEISNILGYNSVHYFSKQFKKCYGISPTEYSKSIKQ